MDKGIKAARIADQIRDYMAQWTRQDMPQTLFSITQVTLTPDLGKAIIWVEAYKTEETEKLVAALRKKGPYYQHRLITTLKKRAVPELVFEADKTQDLNQRFDELLKS
jgi:ribosome-binding factor A